ncbi:eukaryotic translation initiation factor 4 gamma 1-like isoform X3 [Homarus americanus]|uniref:eukaryotic translation initiation factor 4 gamma 1-like isoform X3 n=1 Tax=Homarus americanus TaxID=6706 RepID=UPI001C44DB05|nr:eukaryotic translation initiation factor 4 gamma 1-like isoform X3 [Homarus americanus]
MQQHPPAPSTAPPSGYMYPWVPPAPILPIYERLTTHLVRHDTITTLDLLRCPTLLPNKGPPYHHHQYWRNKHRFTHNFAGGDVGGFSGGPGGATGASLRLNQYPAPHPPPAAAPQPPQGPPQLRTQPQPPPHNPHNATAAPPVPHSQHHTHTHATLTQHSQHHQVLQGGGVGGHGTGGVGTGVGQVGVPPGPSPAPPGPPHDLSSQSLPPGSTPQIQQGSGGTLPVASAHSMMYSSTTQNQPQGPQPNAQGQFYPHPGGPNAPPHLHSSGQPRQVTIAHSQHIPSYPVMPPNVMQFYPSAHGGSNLVYQLSPVSKNGIRQILNGVPAGRGRWLSNRASHPTDLEFQTMGPHRQATPHSQPGQQFHPTQMAQPHPQGPYQTIQYHQPQGVFYPPATQQPPLKPAVVQAPQRERKTLAIVDPSTGKNILDDMNNEKPDKTPTPPQSSESSASNTPAPSGTPPTKTESAVIAAQFAAEVAKKAAEKDDMDIETEHVVRTNKPSDNSSSIVIISDSRENKEKLNNSIGNKVESVSSNIVDSGIGKTVPESVEVIKPQPKQQQQQQDSQQMPLQQFPHQVPPLQQQHLSQQLPQQSLQQQPLQQLQQQPIQQPLQQLQQQPIQQLQQQPIQQPLQQLQQQPIQQPLQPIQQQPPIQQPLQPIQQPLQPIQQPLQQPLQQLQQQPIQQPLQQLQQQPIQQPLQQLQQQPMQQQPMQQQPIQQQQAVQTSMQQLPQQSLHQLPPQQPSPQPLQQVSQPPSQQPLQQLPQPAPQQAPQQLTQPPPQKQKPPASQQPQQPVQQPPQPPVQQQPQQPPPPPPSCQLPHQPAESVSPQPQPQPQQQAQTPQTQKHPDSLQKTEALGKPLATAQTEARETQPPVKAEPQPPVKQPSPKPAVVPTPSPKEKEVNPEPQSAQSKRGKGVPREETTPARDTVVDSVEQPQQPQIPAPPQKAATPAAVQQPADKIPTPVTATKEKKEKEKTPEPVQPVKPQPPPPQKPTSAPPSKEATPQPAPSPTLPEEPKSERSSKDREINSVEREVNNVHDEKEEEKKDDGPQLKYSYKEDQWSPVNPEGKRQYDRRFLLELQNNPLSLKKPESLPNLEVVRDGPGRHKGFDPRGLATHVGGGPDFTPDYVKSAMGNKQPRMVGRNSQQRRETGGGPVNRGGGGGRSGQAKIIVIPSTGRESKLKTTENAWKPSVKESKTSEDTKTDEVVKVMRGILNKLTPEKFARLVDTVKTLPINTTERLSAVIDLIFEKAVDEQGFSSTYAEMCQVLSLMSVRGNGMETGNPGKSEVKFRNLIINKCQKEFEKDNTDEFKAEKRVEIEMLADVTPEKKLELLAKFDYEETKMRKRSVGNIRFIGELYKLRMLTSPIMMRIIGTLLEKGDEESLECLCKLLTTIGKILESQCAQQPKAMSELDKHFKHMDRVVNERQTNSRVRFLMMDVIDLRQNNWIPRREDSKPKTKAQVQEEFKREEIEQQIALASNTNRRDDRDRDRDRRRSRDNRGPQMSDDGWNTVASTKGRTSFDSSRLKNTFSRPGAAESKEVTLRGTGFGNWARGSLGGGLKDHDEGKQQESNRFNVLMDSMGGNAIPGDNRRGTPSMGGNRLPPGGAPARQGGFGSKSMPPPSNDKESAISAVKKFVGQDRSKSTSRPESRDSSVPRETGDALRGYQSIDEITAEKFANAIIEEYTHNADPGEAKLCIREKFAPNTIKYFVQSTFEWVLDRDAKKRRMVGQLYHDLIVESLLSVDQLLEGSQSALRMTEEYEIDIPQVYDYLGEIFAPCLIDNAVSLKRLIELSSFSKKKANIFASILAKAAMIMSPNKVADVWNSSGLSWSSIIPPGANVEDFLAKFHVEFTVDRSNLGNQSGWNPQKVEGEFLKLFKRASNDEIFGWIDANIGNDAKSSKFIRALVTALVESQATTSNDGSSIRVSEDFEDKMKNRLAVVLKYVDNNESLEMQCIFALQALSVKHQHPPGLLEKCFNAFYDSEVVSEEAFDEWAKSQDPEEQEGKGVCVNSVKNFMRWLKEADVEETETHA